VPLLHQQIDPPRQADNHAVIRGRFVPPGRDAAHLAGILSEWVRQSEAHYGRGQSGLGASGSYCLYNPCGSRHLK